MGRVLGSRAEKIQRRVRRLALAGEALQRRLLLFGPLAAKLSWIVKDQRRVHFAPHRQRLRAADIDDRVARSFWGVGIGEAADPAQRLAAVGNTGVPEAHRGEVREAGVGIAAAFDDRHVAVFVETLESHQRGMEAGLAGDGDRLVLGNPEHRTDAVVLVIAVRHDCVEAVVASRQLHHDENAIGVFPPAAGQGFSRQRSRRSSQHERQTRGHADTVEAPPQEVAARAAAGELFVIHIVTPVDIRAS